MTILEADYFGRADSDDPGTKWREWFGDADIVGGLLEFVGGTSTITVVQSASIAGATADATQTFPAPPTPDNLIVAVHTANAPPGNPGDEWWGILQKDDGTGFFNRVLTVYAKMAVTGTSASVTIPGTGTSSDLHIYEISGLGEWPLIDPYLGWVQSGANLVTTLAPVLSESSPAIGKMLLAAVMTDGSKGGAFSYTGGFTPQQDTSRMGSATQVASVAGTFGSTITWTTAREAAAAILAFQRTGGGIETAAPFDTDGQWIEATFNSGRGCALTLRQNGGQDLEGTESYLFRWSPNLVSNQPGWTISYLNGLTEIWLVAVPLGESTPPSFPMRLRFEAVGGHLRGYCNDQLMAEVVDETLSGSGYRHGALIGHLAGTEITAATWGDMVATADIELRDPPAGAANIVLAGAASQEATFEAAALVLTAQPPTLTAGAVTRTLDAAQLTLTAQAPAATVAPVSRNLDAASLILTARDLTPQIAARSFTLEAAALVLAAQDASWTAVATRTFEAAALVLGAQDLTATAGSVTRTLDAAEVVLTARDLARAITPISLTATEAHLVLTAQDPQLAVAPITRTLEAATLALEARDPTISIVGITRTFEAAALLLIAQDLLKGLPKLEVIQVIRVLDSAQRILVTAGDQSIGGDDPGQTAEFSEAVD